MGQDLDLDISDELAREAYRPFHAVDLDSQTEPTADGRQFSPHDPGLPTLLAIPMRLGGWALAKATIALCAGVLATLTAWVAIRRFGVAPRWAFATVGVFAITTPLGVYATQVYPEIPGALVVMTVVAAVTGSRPTRTAIATVLGATALVWLSVKYAPVAVALVLVAGLKLRRTPRDRGRRGRARRDGRRLPARPSRGVRRLDRVRRGRPLHEHGGVQRRRRAPPLPRAHEAPIGLVVDREFGLAAWAPAWLLLFPALGALARRRPADHSRSSSPHSPDGWWRRSSRSRCTAGGGRAARPS